MSLLHLSNLQAVEFRPLAVQDSCIDVSYTIGGQYVDPENGVPDNKWSMLTRWQGLKSHDSFVFCSKGEININTWKIPHIQVVGGGYNDMFGYSWNSSLAPPAFPTSADLIIQVHDLYVPKLLSNFGPSNPGILPPVLQVALFAYLVDASQPNLHPIAIVSLTHSNLGFDYVPSVAFDYPTGVWFSTFPIGKGSDFNTFDPYTSVGIKVEGQSYDQDFGLNRNFYRMRIGAEDWKRTIRAINAQTCSNCPRNGYSENPADWKLKYAGLIAEVTLWDSLDGRIGEGEKDQMNTTIKWRELGIYHRFP